MSTILYTLLGAIVGGLIGAIVGFALVIDVDEWRDQ